MIYNSLKPFTSQLLILSAPSFVSHIWQPRTYLSSHDCNEPRTSLPLDPIIVPLSSPITASVPISVIAIAIPGVPGAFPVAVAIGVLVGVTIAITGRSALSSCSRSGGTGVDRGSYKCYKIMSVSCL